MARVHEIGVGVDTRQFEDGIKRGLVRPTEDAQDAFKDLERSVSDAGSDGARSIDKLEDALRDAQRQSEKTERAMDDIGDGGKRGIGTATEATAEFKDEARANFSEVTSSFDGSMSSIQDLAQGTLGGLASTGLPGVGLAAGAAAVGVGLIGAALGQAEEERQKLEERANDLADAYIQAGSTVLDALTVADRTAGILTDPEQRKEAEKLAKVLGGDLALATRVLAGDTAALTEAQTMTAGIEEEILDLRRRSLGASAQTKAQIGGEISERENMIAVIEREVEVQKQAADTARVQSEIYGDLINSTQGVTEEVDELGNRLLTLPDGKQILINAETGLATADVSAFKGDLDGLSEPVTATVVFDDTQARRDLAAFRTAAQQRLGVPITFETPASIRKPQLLP